MGEIDRVFEAMDLRPGGQAPAAAAALVARAQSLAAGPDAALAEVRAGLGGGPFALVVLFVAPDRDPQAIAAAARRHFAGETVIGCSTAGEIGRSGYLDGSVVGVALPASHFSVSLLVLRDLAHLGQQLSIGEVLRRRSALANAAPNWSNEFALLLADGLSLREDQLVAALGPALGTTPLFGGSAGDGVSFRQTRILAEGSFRPDAAVVAFIRTACRVKVFRFDHLIPTELRMVVTEADPASRIVREINAEPAARAYARALGRDPDQLSPFIFAAHPVVVRMGGKHHVCAIQRVEPNGDLRFFTAVEEGMVLTLACGQNIAEHLSRSLDELSPEGAPDAIIAAECILRRLEVEETQVKGRMSQILASHQVIGFNSYGEQFNMLHVNQTFTGVAIYPPPHPWPAR